MTDHPSIHEILAKRLAGEDSAAAFWRTLPSLGLPTEHATEVVDLILRRASEAVGAQVPRSRS